MIVVARMAAEDFRKAIVVEERRGLELGPSHPREMLAKPIAHEAEREGAVLDGPDRAAVIAVRVVRGMLRRECSDAPPAEEIGSDETIGGSHDESGVGDARRETVTGVRADRTDL